MELPRASTAGSGNSPEFTQEMAETFKFREEIQSLMAESDLQQSLESPRSNDNSFSVLLGLPTNQAIELLHEPESGACPVIHSDGSWSDRQMDRKPKPLGFPLSCYPTFPSNAVHVERAARLSIFGEESPQTSSDPSNAPENSMKLKIEPTDSDSNPNSSPIISAPAVPIEKQRSGKRKEGEKNKVKAPAKKSKNVEDGSSKAGEESKGGGKLPYIHVRARRGQATDSHSLAERARREKINARMKLLQELVPGCNKISGTALVLDEIINHVQSLQHQVEVLSMKLAAVNPRLDFSGLDTFFTSDSGDLNVAGMVAMDPSLWLQLQGNVARRQQQQHSHADLLSSWQRDESQVFMTPENTLQGYDSSNSVAQHSNHLKMEL